MRQINMLARDAWDHGSMRHGYKWRGAALGKRMGSKMIGGTVYDLLSEGDRTYPYHAHHATEEWLLVIDGTPKLRHPGGEWELKEGDILCFPPGPTGAHQVFGPGTVLILSNKPPLDVVEYPDSGKIGISSPKKVIAAEPVLDYWHGEEIPETPEEDDEQAEVPE